MIKHIYDKTGTILIGTEEATPVHDKDFCNACGDCLACYGEDACTQGLQHIWIEYEEE